jgi:hypothetical protein
LCGRKYVVITILCFPFVETSVFRCSSFIIKASTYFGLPGTHTAKVAVGWLCAHHAYSRVYWNWWAKFLCHSGFSTCSSIFII